MCEEEEENVVLDEFRVCVSMFGSESISSNSRVVMSYLEKYSEDDFTSSREILRKRRFRFLILWHVYTHCIANAVNYNHSATSSSCIYLSSHEQITDHISRNDLYYEITLESDIKLGVSLPLGYPRCKAAAFTVQPHSDSIEEKLKELSESKLSDQDVCVHDAVLLLEESIAEDEEEEDKEDPISTTSNPNTISRAFFWTHHTRVKQKKIYVWAKELRVTGIITVSKPGYLLVEAQEANMQEFTKRNLAEHWKEIRLTWQESQKLDTTTKTVDEARWFPEGLTEISISEFASSIRKIGQSRILPFGTRGAILK